MWKHIPSDDIEMPCEESDVDVRALNKLYLRPIRNGCLGK